MRKIWAVTRNTLAQAVRIRAAFVIMAVYLVLVPCLPMVVEGDGTLSGLLSVVITYSLIAAGVLLGILTLALSTTTLWTEIRDKQIFIIESKPIRRWQLLVGKLLGIVLINAVLLVFIGVVTWGAVHFIVRQERWHPRDRDVAWQRVLTGRRVLNPVSLVSEEDIEGIYEQRKLARALPEGLTESAIKQQIREQQLGASKIVSIGEYRYRSFEGIHVPRSAPTLSKGKVSNATIRHLIDSAKKWRRGQWAGMTLQIVRGRGRGQARTILDNTANGLFLSRAWETEPDRTSAYRIKPPPVLRFKFHRADGNTDTAMRCKWLLGSPVRGNFHEIPLVRPGDEDPLFKPGTYHELLIPIDAVDDDGRLEARLLNDEFDPKRRVMILLSRADAVQVLVPAASFTINLVRGLAIILIEILFLAVLGLFCSTLMTFPVSPIVAVSLLFLIHLAASVKIDLDKGVAFDHKDDAPPSLHVRAFEHVVRGLVHVVRFALPPFDRYAPSEMVGSGFEVSPLLLLEAFATTVVARAGLLLLLGVFIFERRELALHSR